ncbi:MAG TPA: extracellular solute-binding protein [Firmicutes bacterium]|nr:extracellular solute-binding protein [Bacillota bacterium]
MFISWLKKGLLTGLMSVCLTAMIGLLLVGIACAEPIEIVIQGNPNQMRALQPLIDEYNAQQNRIHVSLINTEISNEQMVVNYVAGLLPDIIESGPRFNHVLARAGILTDLTPYIQRAGGSTFMAQFIPATLLESQHNGRYYALPTIFSIEGMYYNPEVLGQSGLSAPSAGWTWDDLKKMAQKARRYNPDGSKQIYPIISEGWFQADFPMLGQAGGEFVTQDYKVVINSQPVRDTFGFITQMIDEDLWEHIGNGVSSIHGPNERVPNEAWFTRTAFTFSATYRQERFTQNNAPFVTAPPIRYKTDTSPSTRFTDRGWAICNVSQERKDAAWEVVSYLLQPKQLAQWVASMGMIPATRGAIIDPVFRNYLNTNKNMQTWVNEYSSLPPARAFPFEMEEDMYLADGAVVADLHRQMLKRTISVEAFITEAKRALENLINDPDRPWRHN